MTKTHALSPKQKQLAIGASALLAFVFLMLVANLVYERVYYGRVYPGLNFNHRDVGGLSAESLRQSLDQQALNLDQGLRLCLAEDCLTIQSSTSTSDQIIGAELFTINQTDSFNRIYNYGRGGDFGQNLWDRLRALVTKPSP